MPTIAQSFVPELEQEAVATRRMLERVPQDQLEWRPHPKSMTLGQLALHVAQIPGNLARLAQSDGIDAATVDFRPPTPGSAAELLPIFDASLAEARAFLNGLSDDAALATWRLRAGDREVFNIPRVGFIRSLLLNHWYHHRGQLAVYLRLRDVPLPSVYGPTADENPFTAAA